jgi:2-polyprenyl-3-methyl-5-hydroxy-6-metoxy-1,4-benzoquinol methylase
MLRNWLKLKSLGNQNSPDLLVGLLKQFKPQSILEIGCGYGLLSHYLAIQYPQAEVHGIDLDEKRIRTAQASKCPANLSFSHRNAIDLEDRSWDCIVMVDVLHHAGKENQPTIVGSTHRLLKPGGHLVIREIEPGVSALKYFHAHFFDCVFYWQRSAFMPVEHLSGLIEKAGFPSIEVHHNYPPSWAFPYITYVARRQSA